MSASRIDVGDMVTVNFHNSAFTLCANAEVLYVPRAVGEGWIVKTATGAVHDISEGCTVTRLPPKDTK